MNLHVCDLDRYLPDCATAAELAGITPIYVQQLCKRGEVHAKLLATVPGEIHHWRNGGHQSKRYVTTGGRRAWGEIDLLDLIMLSALRHVTRHTTTIRSPEDILARLPKRCPRCDILTDDGELCDWCRRELRG